MAQRTIQGGEGEPMLLITSDGASQPLIMRAAYAATARLEELTALLTTGSQAQQATALPAYARLFSAVHEWHMERPGELILSADEEAS